jgi:hypothetical protein
MAYLARLHPRQFFAPPDHFRLRLRLRLPFDSYKLYSSSKTSCHESSVSAVFRPISFPAM